MLILQPEIQAMKENDSRLSRLLDAEMSENQDGVSIFYAPENSLVISQLLPLWDFAKDGTPKGIVEVKI